MELPVSGLRILGLLAGLGLIAFAAVYFRGPRWERMTFLLVIATGAGMSMIALFPDTVNWVAEMLDIARDDRGRLIGLLIAAVIGLFVLHISQAARIGDLKQTLDRTIRATSLRTSAQENAPLLAEARNWHALVIVPAYNEEDNLARLLAMIPSRLGSYNLGVAVIDDGSGDQTAKVAREQNALVVDNLFNRGQGGASRAGYDLARMLGVEACVTMDADMQHRPSDLPTLLEPILDGNYDLVIGSRRLGEARGGSAFRAVGIGLMSRLVSLLTGQPFTDVSSGYKAFRISKLSSLNFHEDQFQAAEVLITSVKNGLRVKEVPVTIDRRLHGETKKGHDITYGMRFLSSMFRAWWAS